MDKIQHLSSILDLHLGVEMRICDIIDDIIAAVIMKDRAELEAVVADRNGPKKPVWRAQIILLTADGCGTVEIMRGSGASNTAVWVWQERFMPEGVAGLLRNKTRPWCIVPLGAAVETRVLQTTLSEVPPDEREDMRGGKTEFERRWNRFAYPTGQSWGGRRDLLQDPRRLDLFVSSGRPGRQLAA